SEVSRVALQDDPTGKSYMYTLSLHDALPIFAEIGRRFGLTRARVHQVTAKALHDLRKTWGPRVPLLLDMVKHRLSLSNASELTPALLEQWVGESSRCLRLPRQAHVRLIAELDADILPST